MGGKTATSTQAVSIPPQVLAQYQSVNEKANQTASTPFQQYGGQFVAPVNQQQGQGIAGVNAAANQSQPYFGAATDTLKSAQAGTSGINDAATSLAGSSAQSVDPSNLNSDAINKYMSPYLNTVLGSESALLNQNNQQQQAGQLGTAISSGAFGGDRTGVAAANLEQQQNLSNSNIYGNILNTGYNNALSTAQQQQGVGLAAGQANRQARAQAGQELAGIGATQYGEGANTATTMAGLGTGAQTSALQGSQAQLAAGTVQQQTQQAQDTALYNQFLQQQSYPFQVDQFLANIAEGTGALSGSTTTTQQPGGFFSDERLKEDMEPIGKTFDGQPIYRYKMKGDHREQIGLSAQEVEKKHPHAVGLAGGYRWVDYGKATDEAANRGHFNEGGGVSGGGRVWRPAAYAVGGSPSVVDQNDLRAILEAQSNMYAPMSNGAGVYGASGNVPRGGSSRVPAPSGATPHLVIASGGLRPMPSSVDNAKSVAELGKSAAGLYKQYKQDHSDQQQATPVSGVAAAATPGDDPARARGGRTGYDDGGTVIDFNSILNAHQQMYQQHDKNRDIPTQSGGSNYQLAVASGTPSAPSSGSDNVSKTIGYGKDVYKAYKHFNKPTTTPPTSAPAQVPASTPEGVASGAPAEAPADTSGLGAGSAETAAPAAAGDAAPAAIETAAPAAVETAAPAAAETAAIDTAAPAAAEAAVPAATEAATVAAVDAGGTAATEEAAAALAAEYAAAELGTAAVVAAKRGGAVRSKHADGGTPYRGDGAGTPYAQDSDTMNIPDQQNSTKLQAAGHLQKQPTGLQTMLTMGDPNKASGLAGGMFSNTALARGGLASARRGFDDGGAPADPDTVDTGVARGLIDRSKKAGNLLYTRDGGSKIPYPAPPLKGGNIPPAAVDPDVAAYTDGNHSALADAAWTRPGSFLSSRGATGSWDYADGSNNPPAFAKPVRVANTHPVAPTGVAAGSPEQGPPKPDAAPVTYTGGVGPPAVSPVDAKTPELGAVDKPSWWDKIKGSELSKPENLIPLLTAIGAMGTAPTRSLGVAAASGLTAGAQSYLPVRQELADIQQTGQQTERIGAETQGQKIQNVAELQAQYALKGFSLFPDPNGPIQGPDGKRYVAKPKATAIGGIGQPGATPSQYSFLGNNGKQAAHGEGVSYSMLPDAVQSDSNKQIDKVYEDGNLAQANMPALHTWEQMVAANPQGLLATGTMHQLRTDSANMWNTITSQMGHPEYHINGVEDAQMAEKVSRGSAAMAEAANQQRSFNALKAFLQQTPNPEMQRGAALRLISDAHMENQQAIDKKNYFDEYDKETQRNFVPGMQRQYLANNALQSFNKDYRPDNYEGERNKLTEILTSHGYEGLRSLFQNTTDPDKKARLIARTDKEYGPNFHRYFTGN